MSYTLNLDAIKQGLMLKTDQELIDILLFSQDSYEPDVMLLMKEILTERGISANEIEMYDEKYLSLKSNISKSQSNYITTANFWPRAAAFIIDIILLRVVWYSWLAAFPPESKDASYGITLLLSLAYFTITEGAMSKTIGMAIMGLKVVRFETKEKIGFPSALSRSIGRLLCAFTFGIGYLSMLVNKNKQALHDRYSKTLVILK